MIFFLQFQTKHCIHLQNSYVLKKVQNNLGRPRPSWFGQCPKECNWYYLTSSSRTSQIWWVVQVVSRALVAGPWWSHRHGSQSSHAARVTQPHATGAEPNPHLPSSCHQYLQYRSSLPTIKTILSLGEPAKYYLAFFDQKYLFLADFFLSGIGGYIPP